MAKKNFTTKQQIDCVKREIALRERCYPNWVAQKRLKPEAAEYEMGCMRSILEILMFEAAMEKEVLKYMEDHDSHNQQPLFGDANVQTV